MVSDRVPVVCPCCGEARMLSPKGAEAALRRHLGPRCLRCAQHDHARTSDGRPPSVWVPGKVCGEWVMVERRPGKRGLWRHTCGAERELPNEQSTETARCWVCRPRATPADRWSKRRRLLPCVDCGAMVLRSPNGTEAAKGVQCRPCLKRNRKANACRAFGYFTVKDKLFRAEEARRASVAKGGNK